MPTAIAAIGYYILAYLLMNLAAFAVVARSSAWRGRDEIDVVTGLGQIAPWTSAAFTLALLSLAKSAIRPPRQPWFYCSVPLCSSKF
ncbi:hypothetical protein N5A92_23485 [Chelativorans sp. EGI FJ00035]|uniref:Uncharacterized protein n=1 Tax=Chelativorans salis TaxID=2978478 RepID=A0ABT2LTX6_9HYPH|nr:hypothetical protein [Chelativorans sp. EGI FJ00035]MCT7377985.1 hypothetical protein [Chelativorans sp. EGI FJ00035]